MKQTKTIDYPVGMLHTGQTTAYLVDGGVVNASRTGQDGELQKGVKPEMEMPRFTDDKGTVTDTLTGLIWLKNANCAKQKDWWEEALAYVIELNTNGTMNGNSSDDTNQNNDWRLPNVRELQSLIDYGQTNDANEATIFEGLQTDAPYWSSTTCINDKTNTIDAEAWAVEFEHGKVSRVEKDGDEIYKPCYIWAVRGGEG